MVDGGFYELFWRKHAFELVKQMALVRIYIPVSGERYNELYYKGHTCSTMDSSTTIYLTRFSPEAEILTEKIPKKSNVIFGYSGDSLPNKAFSKLSNNIVFNKKRTQLNRFHMNDQVKPTDNTIIMFYDYNKVRDSQTITESVDISKLQQLIHAQNGVSQDKNKTYAPIKLPYWLTASMFLQHICNYLNLIKWFTGTLKSNKKISIKQGNLILAVLTDVMLGYVLLQMLPESTGDVRSYLMDVLERLINMLYSLLTWLMGAPVGLKLNNAFNKMLGKYFSYHVQLWWLFLDTCSTKLDALLDMYYYIGYLGLTFQIAVISDTICVATFHSYCIYVYAARLFNIQISGLIALLRLFVGRKYNPLRGGIDSCEYTNQELFVGTVAFTILLLLLPTTAMYYIVFTVFRILSIAIQYILAKLIYIVQTLPLYVAALWLTKSHKVAGNILLEVEDTEETSDSLVVRVELLSKSIVDLISQFKPPVEVPQHVEWTNLISNVLVGKQIV